MSCFGAPHGRPKFPYGAAPCPKGLGHERRLSLSRVSSPWCSTACGVTEWSSASNKLLHDDRPAKEPNPPLTTAERAACLRHSARAADAEHRAELEPGAD
jgi:hypothetical protein